ncbi:HET-domain-containing protein, partial [Lepidopterella palustris CBS 459.81]
MRLLELKNHGEFSLTKDLVVNIPPYAILSHTWGEDGEEVTFTDLVDNTGKNKAGYAKIKFCGEQAAIDGLQYFWVDTCCIDKSSSAELTEAINSMFRWYHEAAKCYVYLSDVSIYDYDKTDHFSQSAFRKSRWFTRGWTLQELIAPTSVEFFSLEGKRLGDKRSMEKQIHEITEVDVQALRGGPLSDFSVADRMLWAAKRETTREEDKAYCLLGIFNIHMPLIYGEGKNAFIRLNNEINNSSKASQAETLPTPSSTIPFRRDPDFVDRGSILDQIQQKCEVSGSRTALVGLGGIGKSQLAIEYAYRVIDRSPETWVFWIHASNAARFEQSYRKIADKVKIPGRNDPKANIIKLAHDWLQNENMQKWFLILDNFDDAAFLVEAPSTSLAAQKGGHNDTSPRPLSDYLPQGENGSMLITTRRIDAALTLLEESDIIAVDSMDARDAELLFQKKLRVLDDAKDIANLVEALEFMPLAIVQAASYIAQRAPRCSARQYIEKFQKSDKGKTSLLNHEGGHLRRDWEASSSILITWQLSFDHVRQTRPSAADLLSLMSFFDRQGIPEALIQSRGVMGDRNKSHRIDERNDGDEDDASDSGSDDEFENDIMTLRHYSFISVGVDGATLEMHGLVQLAMRKWLEKHGQLERWKQKYIRKLFEEFPTGEHENWQKCLTLFPHAKGAIAQKPKAEDSMEEWSMLLYNAAWYSWRRGIIADAENFSVKSMKARKISFGPDHVKTLSSMAMVGLVYNLGGRWKEAEDLE